MSICNVEMFLSRIPTACIITVICSNTYLYNNQALLNYYRCYPTELKIFKNPSFIHTEPSKLVRADKLYILILFLISLKERKKLFISSLVQVAVVLKYG